MNKSYINCTEQMLKAYFNRMFTFGCPLSFLKVITRVNTLLPQNYSVLYWLVNDFTRLIHFR